jgi:hypothetical protein
MPHLPALASNDSASETVQLTLRFCSLPVTALTREMRVGLVDRVATMAQVQAAAVHITSAVAETTAETTQRANQSSTGCTTVVCVNVTDLTVSEAATVSHRLSLHNLYGFATHGNGSATPLPNATSAHVSVLTQAPVAPGQHPHRPQPHARALAVMGCISILVLLTIVRSLAVRHYEMAVQTQISANTDVIVERVSPTGSSASYAPAPKHRYERVLR